MDDRPFRAAGRQSVGQLVADWDRSGFGTVPPNAVLQISAGTVSQVFVLRSPRADAAARTLEFEATLDPGLQAALPTAFGPASLFIDSTGNAGGDVLDRILIEVVMTGRAGISLRSGGVLFLGVQNVVWSGPDSGSITCSDNSVQLVDADPFDQVYLEVWLGVAGSGSPPSTFQLAQDYGSPVAVQVGGNSATLGTAPTTFQWPAAAAGSSRGGLQA